MSESSFHAFLCIPGDVQASSQRWKLRLTGCQVCHGLPTGQMTVALLCTISGLPSQQHYTGNAQNSYFSLALLIFCILVNITQW